MKPFGQVETTLKLLKAVESGGMLSQRGFAARLGVALGLTNALLKRAVKKGLIKVKDVPAKRYGYYLTPKGFSEKSKLSAEYLSASLHFFRRARNQYEDVLLHCQRRGWTRIVIVGSGELAEIATLAMQSCDVMLLGVIDATRNTDTFCGLPVYADISKLTDIDAYIVTDAKAPQKTFDALCAGVAEDRIMTPSILHISRGNIAKLTDEEAGDDDA
jgi:DNA-binding MarR family transcriptional regulator